MARIVRRAEWGAAAPKAKTPLAPSQLKGVCVHWFGSPKAATSHRGCASLLRSVQSSHMSNTAEGYVDIAYSHAVCPHGVKYELRGFGVRSGANGTSFANSNYAAVVYMAGTGDVFTAEAKKGMRELIQAWRAKGAGTDVKPHGYFTGSTCPGPSVKAWLDGKGYEIPLPPKARKPYRVDVFADDKKVNTGQDIENPALWVRVKRFLRLKKKVRLEGSKP